MRGLVRAVIKSCFDIALLSQTQTACAKERSVCICTHARARAGMCAQNNDSINDITLLSLLILLQIGCCSFMCKSPALAVCVSFCVATAAHRSHLYVHKQTHTHSSHIRWRAASVCIIRLLTLSAGGREMIININSGGTYRPSGGAI